MEISLYAPNIFQLGQEVMFTKHIFILKTNKKNFFFIFLDQKTSI